ncbi:hypothetical protein E2C01_060251 [Portunus trituberculatus]|uniref:Secreted protein n=1 Tax=Portunus trituberculatus TaxID=210409 RepID=A0A5B7H9Y8_PORTR|nr:hypothetical protein [Portunus trituberculatus]
MSLRQLVLMVCFDKIVRLAAGRDGGGASVVWKVGYFRPRYSGSSVGNCLAPHCLFTAKVGGSGPCRAYPVHRNAVASPKALCNYWTETGGAEPAMTPKRQGEAS